MIMVEFFQIIQYRFMFSCVSYQSQDTWHSTRSEVCKISISFLMNRCSSIINHYLIDESDLGTVCLLTTFLVIRINLLISRINFFIKGHNFVFCFTLGKHTLPNVRTEELIFVLQELARMTVHPEMFSVLHIPHNLKEQKLSENTFGRRSHLLVMFPSFCELVASRFLFFPSLSLLFLFSEIHEQII